MNSISGRSNVLLKVWVSSFRQMWMQLSTNWKAAVIAKNAWMFAQFAPSTGQPVIQMAMLIDQT
jgi:hypothetical protein